ncbi:MAG: hypothetical protein IKZ82_11245 [Clostridia bacterium]|nr:hypothetical protein [Clostridia bacterium]
MQAKDGETRPLFLHEVDDRKRQQHHDANQHPVCKVNVDDDRDLAVRYGVQSIPTLIVFKNGDEVRRELGVKPKGAILEMLK